MLPQYSSSYLPTNVKFALLNLGVEIKDGPAAKGNKANMDSKTNSKANTAVAERSMVIIEQGGLQEKDGCYGDLSLVSSKFKDSRVWADMANLSPNTTVWLRGRLHAVRAKGKFAFLVLRRGVDSCQVLVEDGQHGMSREACKWISKVSNESVVDIFGDVVSVDKPINSVSAKNVEIRARKMFVVSLAANTLPFQLEDAARPVPADGKEKEGVISVGQDVRLDNRWIDVRTPTNNAIFKIQSRVCQFYRQFFLDRDFVEIHTPKLTPGVSEGGANVFKLKYFGTPACLAQSPQLYKQMAISSDLMNVFEIGPVFRAEDSNTHRHCTEFTGMDFEMEIKQHYHEVLHVLGDLFISIFDNLNKHCQAELKAIHAQFPFSPLLYLRETLVLSFKDAVALLRADGETMGDFDDFSTPQEKRLGKIVREKYKTDFYIVDKYPKSARPFYTMPCPFDPNYTNSYDVFVRGEEITSGAQRVHDYTLLRQRIIEFGIPLESIQPYLESFRYGAWPHGGAGIGLERVVMLFLGLDNIRKSSLFPRTPARLTP